MSYDSFKNKALVQFPNGKMMLFAEVSASNVTDWNGKRCWDKCMFHPEGTLYYTKETLKAEQTKYVEEQLQHLREFSKFEVEKGYAEKYEEPTLESINYCGTVWPSGRKIKHGKAFFGGRPKSSEEFFGKWDSPRRITFVAYNKDDVVYRETFDILREDLDDCYAEAMKYGKVYIDIR